MEPNQGNLTPGGSGATAGGGLAPNVAGALSYVLGLVTGILFLVIEQNRFVRFHAYQAIFLSVAWIALWIGLSILTGIVGMIPGLGLLVALLGLLVSLGLSLGGLVLWIVLIARAYQGHSWKLPYIGDMAERYAGSRPTEPA